MWSRLGSEVTVIEYLDRLIPTMDAEIADSAKKIPENTFFLAAVMSRECQSNCLTGSNTPDQCDSISMQLLAFFRRLLTSAPTTYFCTKLALHC